VATARAVPLRRDNPTELEGFPAAMRYNERFSRTTVTSIQASNASTHRWSEGHGKSLITYVCVNCGMFGHGRGAVERAEYDLPCDETSRMPLLGRSRVATPRM
jgi:hypothetical protein